MKPINQKNISNNKDEYILELSNINKRFPGVKALNEVSFKVQRGEIHGLVGENGAGKSTLLKILSGVYQKDSGSIKLNNEEIVFKTPIEAQEKGICMEYQEKATFLNLTAGENIVVGRWGDHSSNKAVVSWKNIHKAAAEILEELNFDINTKTLMSELSPEKQQIIQIARAIAIKGNILILDEPTAAISFSQVEHLFTILRKLKDEGYTIIYVSHHLKEIFSITDNVTILKDGECVGTYQTSSMDEKKMVNLMVGRDIRRHSKSTFNIGNKEILKISGLNSKDKGLQDVSFTLRQGEILGVAGLLGSGKDLLARAIVGLKPLSSGEFELDGKRYVPKTPKQVIRQGITVLPADRTLEGIVLEQTLTFNITLSSFKKFTKFGVMNRKRDNELAENAAQEVNLKYVTLRQQALSLSGGNQQRLMIARALLTSAKVIVFNEPTQGVDVGAKAEIYQLIRTYVKQGGSVILISSELPELLGLSDRIVVMSKGKLVAEYSESDATEEKLLEKMIG